MIRLILIIVLFIASLVNFFPVPAKEVWYAGIAITEFPWIFMLATLLFLFWTYKTTKYRKPCLIIGSLTFIIFSSPVFRAYGVAGSVDKKLQQAFNIDPKALTGFKRSQPFSFFQLFSKTGAKTIPFKTYTYATHSGVALTLNYSPSALPGIQPCLVEVHGGSWKRGDNSELAHFNNYFANAGYNVVTIDYRLAPTYSSPAQLEDIHAAMLWLKENAAMLSIDTSNFVLTGRSAGAQLVLTAAYNGQETGVKGVAAFYGPTDMWWTYDHPDSKLIMDSRQVQSDFLGGSPEQVPARYTAESPLLLANASSVPTLLVHGKNDAHVFFEQSRRMAKKLDSLKVPNMLLALPWGTHGCEYNLNGPSGQLSLYTMERFLYAVTRQKAIKN